MIYFERDKEYINKYTNTSIMHNHMFFTIKVCSDNHVSEKNAKNGAHGVAGACPNCRVKVGYSLERLLACWRATPSHSYLRVNHHVFERLKEPGLKPTHV